MTTARRRATASRAGAVCLAGSLIAGMLMGLGGCSRPVEEGLAEALPGKQFGSLAATEVLATGSSISGANGIAFGPDGLLYVASVIGSEIVVMDPRDGMVRRRLASMVGVQGPDDLAFGPDGSMYWTSILTGEIVGFDARGQRIIAGKPGAGVNPITFADDGRLFVAQCFFDTGVYEVDPTGQAEPRLITDDLGPGCGLNGMDWGSDGRLYGPRWFTGEVVSLDVASGERRVEADGFKVPAAVKFDGRGRLHVLDTATGQVLRLEADGPVEAVRLPPGLDNFAFDLRDQLYVSSFIDGSITRVEEDGSTVDLAPPGMSYPGGVAAVLRPDGGVSVYVADLYAVRGFDGASGESILVERDILGVGDIGSVLGIAADGENLILTSFMDNTVRTWNPATREVGQRFDDLAQPVSAVRYGTGLAVAEFGSGRVILVGDGAPRVLAEGLRAPAGLATDGEHLYVSDRKRGRIFEIARDGLAIPPREVIKDLESPEGLAVYGEELLVVESESGRVQRIRDGQPTLLALVAPGRPPAADIMPPSMIFNGLAVVGDTLFVTGETNRVLYRIALAASSSPANPAGEG